MVESTKTSKKFLAHELSRICHRKCKDMSDETDKSLCESRCDNAPQIPESSSKTSEKLTSIVHGIRFDSAQLSCIADEIDAYNSMSI